MTKIDFNDQYVQGDAFKKLFGIHHTFDLVFTSPPDLSQTEFGKKQTSEYQDWQRKSMTLLDNITKDDGHIVICQTDRKVNGEVLPNHITYYNQLTKHHWKLKDYKPVFRTPNIETKNLYKFNYQHLMIFGKKGSFARKGDILKQIYIDHQVEKDGQMVWTPEFCKWIINALTKPGDLICDPFAGFGPVLWASKELDRRYFGVELIDKYYDPTFAMFRERLI